SFVDALLVGAPLPRFVRFMLHREYYDLKSLTWFFRLMHAIPVSANNRRDIVESLKRARNELDKGHVVCIFAEGAISRTGRLLPFKRGFEKIVEDSNIPIVPVHLDQLWGSIFSFKDGKFFWKWPKIIPYSVTVSFGPALPPTSTVTQVRNAILELESEAVEYRRLPSDLLHTKFVEMAKCRWSRFCMADTTGSELTYGKTLIGSLLFCRWLRSHCANQKLIGVILPASVGGALVNIAITLAGKVPVNLNFTAGKEAMAEAAAQCQIETIVTSRVFLEKANREAMDGMVFVEEIRETFSGALKFTTAARAYITPARCLTRRARGQQRPHDLATIIFSSGSTGTPKGVMLSHHNIISNIEAISQVVQFTPQDRILGILPLFHSFGFTATIWLPVLTGFGAVYHPNPTDAKTIGETVQKYRATLMISTPTFYVSYWRRCTREQFSSLRYVIAGAEKLREQIAKGYQEKFGITILEGYGCTELSPVVAVNTPDVLDGKEKQTGHKPGTVGQPLPGVAAKVIDPENGETLGPGQAGLLLVKGPNVMLGYLNQQNLTDQAMRRDWYVTGDIATIDDDGFVTISDRLSRFSKIGGEMVPHMKIEEMINEILGSPASVVTAIPDEHRGERLVVFYAKNSISRDELWDKLNKSELPKLWIPKRDDLRPIDEIPVLGSGKADLKKIKALALEKACA
ncbi:MAG TPA: AMP-binding protein, partial [Candidatus Binatia bacterium]|nr:AMP-binding protein [Candidatus Binatia bacterium]